MFGVIGLDAAHVRRLLGHEDLHEFGQTGFELGGRLGRQTPGRTGEKRGDGEETSGRAERSERRRLTRLAAQWRLNTGTSVEDWEPATVARSSGVRARVRVSACV